MTSATSRTLTFGLLLGMAHCGRAASLEEFGLEHALLGGATWVSNIYRHGFVVENLNHFGDRGDHATSFISMDYSALALPVSPSSFGRRCCLER